MKGQLSPQTRTLTHIYVREAARKAVHPCWAQGGRIYCGICLRGEVSAEVGAVCQVCASAVALVLETTASKPAKDAPRSDKFADSPQREKFPAASPGAGEELRGAKRVC